MSSTRFYRAKVLLSHPGCPPFVQHVARALYEAGLLSAYVTAFAYQPESWLGRTLKSGLGLLSNGADKELQRRRITEIPESLVITHPLPELARILTVRSLGRIAADSVWEKAELWFDKIVARKHLNGERAVYAYEHAALETFKAQRHRGGLNIYDMPTAHHHTKSAILEPEFEKYPEVQTEYDRHLKKYAARRKERKDQELGLADLIVCPSDFVKHSLINEGISANRIAVVPFGAPSVVDIKRSNEPGPVIFLSAGNQSIQKGTHYLIDAWRRLSPGKDLELWLIGAMNLPERVLEGIPGRVTIRPNVPRAELFEIYRQSSVLVLPTLFEGFALVITEAMAHGLAVITTPNSGGAAFIDSGKDGFIVPACDSIALAETMQWCVDNREGLRAMGHNAAAKAGSWQWSNYRSDLAKVVSEKLCNTLLSLN
jgi:glycosyltransferase involved in cell wall biosynthesis